MTRDFFRRLEVGLECGLLNVTAFGGSSRVDVDRDQCLGRVQHDRAARGESHFALEGGLNLAFDLKAVKQGEVVLVLLESVLIFRHDHADKLCRALVGGRVIDQYLIDVVAEVVAHCANNDVALLINQNGCLTFLVRLGDRFPEL
ncbi:MAG: Uncharacterised protein [Halieaceae bacterium]|nr:MAG: Uncharacterised protein [Halieaceae bacterium]